MKDQANQQIGFYCDQTRCTGCDACVIACKQWHDVPPGPASWMRIQTIEEGHFPNVYLGFLPSRCLNCENAPCVTACPVDAITKRQEDGIVVVDREQCLGRDVCGHDCSNACPAGTDVRGFVSLVKQGKHEEAWELIAETNPFPGVCGRICAHPCEEACVRGQIDQPVAIHALERLAADHMTPTPFYGPYGSEKGRYKVAVVGSGPAGLTCAYHLARRDYKVTVFEALPVVGGMLRIGIPEYRLPKEVLDREIAFIEACGVEIKTNMRLGENLSPADLEEFDAIFLATGAHKRKMLDIPGTDLNGVMSGVDFLTKVNLNEAVTIGKEVLVIGGGDVAIDCARSAVRMGASEVHIACLESLDTMPANPSGVAQAQEEGITIHPSRTFRSIFEENGCCAGIECLKLNSMRFDEYGKLHIDVVENTEHTLSADTIIVAIGQEVDNNIFPKGMQVAKGVIATDENAFTSLPKYFAGGDAAIPEGKVAYAIGSGRKAAEAIDRKLRNLPQEKSIATSRIHRSEFSDIDIFEKKRRVPISGLPASSRVLGFPEVELPLTEEEGTREASRCLECSAMCQLACPYQVPQFGDEDNPKMQKCDSCLDEYLHGRDPICVRACPTRALDAGPIAELKAKYGDSKTAKGFTYFEKSKPHVVFKPKVK